MINKGITIKNLSSDRVIFEYNKYVPIAEVYGTCTNFFVKNFPNIEIKDIEGNNDARTLSYLFHIEISEDVAEEIEELFYDQKNYS